ncbi:beta-1,3-galactosyltransferase 1-like [Dreissena polymorpha]|uniref:Hexosyltransferase n=1 Tax=Dreissena polymorpha TaxID=45954 RepID=A0A9D4BF52_DREPO|nr:beta-1,3-galactosyltransferase 1-like [Dreissena polymorpha]XP_052258808.1 beta-1,3-galactosyltransferase 1-like [Dreissena polymorpha]KAH3692435.1 hypothetical protein DPMN_194275 [Dreissena polymorpha]
MWHPFVNMQGKTNAFRACKSRLTVRFILFSFMTLVVVVLFHLFESSNRLSTVKVFSIKMKSGAINAFNHVLDLYFTNSTIFKTNITFELSTITYSDSSFFEKQYDRFNLEMRQTAIAPSKNEPLNVTAYNSVSLVDLNLTRTEASIENMLAIKSRMKNGLFEKDEMPQNTTVRQSDCDNCFKHDFEYVIQNDHICDTLEIRDKIDLLILVTTVHKNGFIRQTLRRTWLSYTKNNTAIVRHVFLLGKTADDRLQEFVMKENEMYHDIVQETFIDSYHNLTYKTIMGFKWASTKCSNAKFVIKTDDDMWVNVPSLITLLSGTDMSNYLQTGLTGSCSPKASPIRNKNSKWYASFISYPDKFYPGFCSGTGYMTSINVVSDIYNVSPHVPFFHLEDVYVALCARKLGFSLKKTLGFFAEPKLNLCDYKQDGVLTVHQVRPSMLTVIWKKTCSPVGLWKL